MRALCCFSLVVLEACGAPGQGMPAGKIRVLNLFTPDGGTGPSVDVYASPPKPSGTIDPRAEPLIAGLSYGKMSDYIAPLSNENVGPLSFFSAGQKTPSAWYPGDPLPGKFKTDDQAVILLHNCPDATGTPKVCFKTLFEGGATEQMNPLARPGRGKAMFYANTTVLDAIAPGRQYGFGLGGAPCLAQVGTGFEVPAAAATIVMIVKPTTPTCSETPSLSLPVLPRADERYWLFLWGASATDVHVSWLPIP